MEAEGSMNGDRWMKGSAEQNVARRPGSRRCPHPQYEPYVDEVEASETLQGKYQKNKLKFLKMKLMLFSFIYVVNIQKNI